ncbi:hypothetical protein MLD38_018125 [Melastoma candidum]|uniref:Uncharacterized protein n=1 Tax=Melastoma candidum TaxID=119954 RepID=A0ACB9QVZ8_9MYRT|nr:hypothetical protein MLD38_018125 [Melastoma candidum]
MTPPSFLIPLSPFFFFFIFFFLITFLGGAQSVRARVGKIMVKFSKELEAQLIPEWKEAFVNYWQLKKHVKKIKLSRKTRHPQEIPGSDFGRSVFDCSFPPHENHGEFWNPGNASDDQVRGSVMDEEDEDEPVCETELVQLFSEEDEVRVFFVKLDEELGKVNQFYKVREQEFLERGDTLNKQHQILMDLKQILGERRRKNSPSFRGSAGAVVPARTSNFSDRGMDFSETPTESSETEEAVAVLERNGVGFVSSAIRAKNKNNGKPKMAMRIDIPATNPTRTITAEEDPVREKMIRGAFVELYRGLGLLKTYSSLNMMAFTKILKKFDKVANRQESSRYLLEVKKSHFVSSDKIVKLMDEVESVFTKNFASNDRKKAMMFLKPQQSKDSHMITFFVGLFTGSFISLFSIYAILAHFAGIFSPSTDLSYIEIVYPVFSVFALLSLHLFMYGCNLFMWKKSRINSNFIFEFKPNTALKYRDSFLICTTFMTAVVGAMVLHLFLRANSFYPSQVDAIPGILLLIFIALLVCPFDMLYRPTRYCFLRIMRNIVCSPFYKVLMVDFFMADQLTSQIPLLRHIESTACYFIAGSFRTHQYEICKSGRLYRELAYVISFLPYYWRAMQCARRWFDECDVNHLTNMGKYVSAMVAAGARITYAKQNNDLWFGVVLVTSVIATAYQLYWDFVKDWGVLNPKSKNPWLRDDLILKSKSIYYVSIVLNVILRVVWVETVMRFHIGVVESRMLDFSLASLEVFRRGHWNFYRRIHLGLILQPSRTCFEPRFTISLSLEQVGERAPEQRGELPCREVRATAVPSQHHQLRRLNIHEYQGAELMGKYGINVPKGVAVGSADEDQKAILDVFPKENELSRVRFWLVGEDSGLSRMDSKAEFTIVKADEVEGIAGKMLGQVLVTKQTGPQGKVVSKILISYLDLMFGAVYICEKLSLTNEMDFAITLDRKTAGSCKYALLFQLIIACSKGGTSIEDLAEKYPDMIIKVPVDIFKGITDEDAAKVVDGLALKSAERTSAIEQVKKLVQTFCESDCTLLEINPLAETADGQLVAADAKLNFDDNAAYRQKEIFALRDPTQEDPREVAAAKADLNYIGLDGEIGCMVNGAGLAMATMDIIKLPRWNSGQLS